LKRLCTLATTKSNRVRQHLVGIIQGAAGEHVGLDALEDVKVLAVTFVQAVDEPVLLGNLSHAQPTRVMCRF
jgi:hypothetical protein